jgi:hypothetical protein
VPFTFDAAKHPRDRKGRFTKSRTVLASSKDKRLLTGITGGFKPAQTGDGKSYAAKIADPGQAKAARDFAVDATAINEDLRAGHADAQGVKPMDDAMRPLPDDLVLHRSVPAEAFGEHDPQSLQGMKVRDAGFSATQLDPVQPAEGDVRMFIAAPKGSRAVADPDTGEVYLDRDSEMVVSRVEANSAGGHDMYLTVLPKTGGKESGGSAGPQPGEAPASRKAEPGTKPSTADVPAKPEPESAKAPSGPDKPQGEDAFRAGLMKQTVAGLQAQMRERGLKPGKKRKSELVDALAADEMGHDGTKDNEPAKPSSPKAPEKSAEPKKTETPLAPKKDAEPAKPTAPAASVEDRIKTAFAEQLAAQGGNPDERSWAMVSDVRKRLPDISRADFDAAANRLATSDPHFTLAPEANQKVLTDEQRAGAVIRGNQPKHLIGREGAANRGGKTAPAESASASAATGEKALAAAPLGLHRDGVDPDGHRGLVAYQDGNPPANYGGINKSLRGLRDSTPAIKDNIDGIDRDMAASKLTADVVTFRGVKDAKVMFGADRMSGDLTGMRWREDAYVSTAVDEKVARSFGGGPGLQMRILVPAGTGAVDLSEAGGVDEREMLLDRGHVFEVAADHGMVRGVRSVDVRVIPKPRGKKVNLPSGGE